MGIKAKKNAWPKIQTINTNWNWGPVKLPSISRKVKFAIHERMYRRIVPQHHFWLSWQWNWTVKAKCEWCFKFQINRKAADIFILRCVHFNHLWCSPLKTGKRGFDGQKSCLCFPNLFVLDLRKNEWEEMAGVNLPDQQRSETTIDLIACMSLLTEEEMNVKATSECSVLKGIHCRTAEIFHTTVQWQEQLLNFTGFRHGSLANLKWCQKLSTGLANKK